MESNTKVFLSLEEITNEIGTAVEKLDVVNNSILNACNEFYNIKELAPLYIMGIKPIKVDSDIMQDSINVLENCLQQLTAIITQQLNEGKEVQQ